MRARLLFRPLPFVSAAVLRSGYVHCLPEGGVVAVRAGRLFDSPNGRMLTKQIIVVRGERIAEVGPDGQVRIPAGARVIDLSQAMVVPGLIDAHTHMYNAPAPGVSIERATLIAVANLQADLQAGFTAARDMSSHTNGYADVDGRNALNQGGIDGPRLQVAGRGIRWGATPSDNTPANPRAAIVIRTADEARAAVREHVDRGVDWIKLYPTGGARAAVRHHRQRAGDGLGRPGGLDCRRQVCRPRGHVGRSARRHHRATACEVRDEGQ